MHTPPILDEDLDGLPQPPRVSAQAPKPREPMPAQRKAPSAPPPADRTPPHSAEAEEHVLSCCLLDGDDTIARCVRDGLTKDSFFAPANQILFENIVRLHAHPPVTLEVLAEELKTHRLFDAVGGFPYLLQIAKIAPTTARVSYFIEKVREKQVLRELIRRATGAVEQCYSFSVGLDELVANLQADFAEIGQRSNDTGFEFVTIDEILAYVPPVDNALLSEHGGNTVYWKAGDVAMLIGPPGIGKSRLSVQMAVEQILGKQFIGFDMPHPARKWMFIGNESSMERYQKELKEMTHGYSDEQMALIRRHLIIHKLKDDELTVGDRSAVNNYAKAARAFKPDVLVLDPWEAVIIGNDCNDSPAARQSVAMLRSIFTKHNANFTLLIIQHSRTGAEATLSAVGYGAGGYAKGSKTLTAIARLAINLAEDRSGGDETGGSVVVSCGKINNARKFNTRGIKFDEEKMRYFVRSEFNLKEWENDVTGKRTHTGCCPKDIEEAVNTGHTTTRAIVEDLSEVKAASKTTIKRAIVKARECGLIVSAEQRGHWRLGPKSKYLPSAERHSWMDRD